MIILNYIIVCLLTFSQFHSGKSGLVDNTRIMSDDLANPSEIKYIVVTLHGGRSYLCGGGIIDNYYVFSSAHCFVTDNKIEDRNVTVVAGINDYRDKNDSRRVEVEVEKIYVPKQYTNGGYTHDIALLKLKRSLDIEKNDLEKLALPTKSFNLTNRMTLMAGFGHDQYRTYRNRQTNVINEKRATSGHLRKADIKMFDNTRCLQLYPKDPIYESYLRGKMVKESQRREYGVCNCGSPLVYNSTVVGVVSWSYRCNENTVSLVYTRVSSFLDFIENVKNDKTDDMKVE